MSRDDPYLQFPIGALHFGKPITEVTGEEMATRLHEIISYCLVEVGKSLLDNKDYQVTGIMIERSAARMGFSDSNLNNRNNQILLLGAETLNVNLGSLNWKHQNANHEVVNELSPYGSQQCRLKASLAWEAIGGGSDWTWRSLATLCAVYAGIGRYAKAKLTYDRIGAMAMGFNGQRDRDALNAKRLQLTDKQTLRSVATLRDRGFFVSASPNGRHVFYSHRLTLDGLIENLASTAPVAKPTAASVTERIKQRQAELAAKQ
jgi:hypothetical protein